MAAEEEVKPAKRELDQEKSGKSPTSPRKRRKRTPTSGAADDCFACQEKQSKCDRRRPYCTQCLDQGKDCSGYKTALTWGVGVASRGKLRGLSLPIVSSQKVAQTSDAQDSPKSTDGRFSKLGLTRKDSRSSPTSAPKGSARRNTTYNFVNMDPTASEPSPMLPPPAFDFRAPAPKSHVKSFQRAHQKRPRSQSLQPIHVPTLDTVRDLNTMPLTATTLGGYGSDFENSVHCSPLSSNFGDYNILPPTSNGFHAIVQNPLETNIFSQFGPVAWRHDDIRSSIGSDHSGHDYSDDEYYSPAPQGTEDMSGFVPSPPALHAVEYPQIHSTEPNEFPAHIDRSFDLVSDDCGAHTSLSLSTALPSLNIGNTPNLRFLIDYYDKVISPVIVAFDGPTNPYRSHILRLAVESQTLQHAIAALSASNLRQRRGSDPSSDMSRTRPGVGQSSHDHSVRKSSIAHSLMNKELTRSSAYEPSSEELYHKAASIKALNAQLADPTCRQDDSILATLLILCLYHICDTGVAKFKTQFAGVKKILALRGGVSGQNSKVSNWLTIMFTWFEAMTATVNDRESQLSGDAIDMTLSDGQEWALENLAGCDGRLFRTISKLGRLNLLSQGKAVDRGLLPKAQEAVSGPKTVDYYSMNYNRFDGNGWASLVPDEDPLATNPRAQFWREWHTIRRDLQDWHLESSGSVSLGLPDDQRDLSHISESFRYSALLYTERLAHPHLPSTQANFQNLVTEALYHISNVKSDVFLLWPLFITGTECVSERGRSLIRERCLDIQKDSGFFNNISGLELLETIWRDDGDVDDATQVLSLRGENVGGGCQGFKWRKAMEKVDGEYIVV